ncbi:hypothetical protein NQT69_18660 [Pseudoalteromonas shioyasakiensis]|uniref:hypothetical protein n=1 Tax=Pseudoalteromonas shioyasakiensis TaxID=1190813 RepID=UPI00211946BC|nr:hypothetical protein [Pseudoalteromonas shioyasakiensis]MCQ8880024.1 hypothetical protein [Pseudoalteromonas shioyasakiensis]
MIKITIKKAIYFTLLSISFSMLGGCNSDSEKIAEIEKVKEISITEISHADGEYSANATLEVNYELSVEGFEAEDVTVHIFSINKEYLEELLLQHTEVSDLDVDKDKIELVGLDYAENVTRGLNNRTYNINLPKKIDTGNYVIFALPDVLNRHEEDTDDDLHFSFSDIATVDNQPVTEIIIKRAQYDSQDMEITQHEHDLELIFDVPRGDDTQQVEFDGNVLSQATGLSVGNYKLNVSIDFEGERQTIPVWDSKNQLHMPFIEGEFYNDLEPQSMHYSLLFTHEMITRLYESYDPEQENTLKLRVFIVGSSDEIDLSDNISEIEVPFYFFDDYAELNTAENSAGLAEMAENSTEGNAIWVEPACAQLWQYSTSSAVFGSYEVTYSERLSELSIQKQDIIQSDLYGNISEEEVEKCSEGYWKYLELKEKSDFGQKTGSKSTFQTAIGFNVSLELAPEENPALKSTAKGILVVTVFDKELTVLFKEASIWTYPYNDEFMDESKSARYTSSYELFGVTIDSGITYIDVPNFNIPIKKTLWETRKVVASETVIVGIVPVTAKGGFEGTLKLDMNMGIKNANEIYVKGNLMTVNLNGFTQAGLGGVIPGVNLGGSAGAYGKLDLIDNKLMLDISAATKVTNVDDVLKPSVEYKFKLDDELSSIQGDFGIYSEVNYIFDSHRWTESFYKTGWLYNRTFTIVDSEGTLDL